jgi:hypothetical protein
MAHCCAAAQENTANTAASPAAAQPALQLLQPPVAQENAQLRGHLFIRPHTCAQLGKRSNHFELRRKRLGLKVFTALEIRLECALPQHAKKPEAAHETGYARACLRLE